MQLALTLLVILSTQPPGHRASCAWVRAENDAAGTAFVVDVKKKLLVTCRHLVGDHTKVGLIFPWVLDGELVTDRRAYLAERPRLRELGLLVTGKVIRKSDDLDLALIQAESLPLTARTAELAAGPPRVGEILLTIGNRLDLETVWNLSAGPLRATGRLADGYSWRGQRLAVNAQVLIGQLPTEEGDSGAPVFDSRGRVVGMISALRRQSPLAAVAITGDEIRRFAGLPPAPVQDETKRSIPAKELHRTTVWVRPTATDGRLAGVLIEKDLVLTVARGFTTGDRVGIALPIRHNGRWVVERAAYRDLIGLSLKGYWRSGTIIARDGDRDLALIRLDSPVTDLSPLAIADTAPSVGDAVHTMNHPGGIEFAWVYASGIVRQRGKAAVVSGENATPVAVLLCQLPAQVGSPGGAVVNDRGALVGLVAVKESVQWVGYAVAAEEILEFLELARHGRPACTATGNLARIEVLATHIITGSATALSRHAEECRLAGRHDVAGEYSLGAIALDPDCALARICRANLLVASNKPDEAMSELDLAVEKGPFRRNVLWRRAELASTARDWRKARGDLERILDVDPLDAEARQVLANAHLELGDDAKAADAVADTLRSDSKRLSGVARDLLAQAERLEKKFPDTPSIPAGWLIKALTASKREEFADVLKRAAATKTDQARLEALRVGLKALVDR